MGIFFTTIEHEMHLPWLLNYNALYLSIRPAWLQRISPVPGHYVCLQTAQCQRHLIHMCACALPHMYFISVEPWFCTGHSCMCGWRCWLSTSVAPACPLPWHTHTSTPPAPHPCCPRKVITLHCTTKFYEIFFTDMFFVRIYLVFTIISYKTYLLRYSLAYNRK